MQTSPVVEATTGEAPDELTDEQPTVASAPPGPGRSPRQPGEWPASLTEGPLWTLWMPNIVSAIVTLAAGLALLRDARRMWFSGDEWDFLLGRDLGHNTLAHLFKPHNEHWTTLPIIAFRIVYSIFGTRTYLPYGAMAILCHLLAVLALWSVLRRVGTPPWVVTAVVAVFAFLGAGAENTLWDFQICFIGAVLFGLVAMRIAVADRGRLGTVLGVWAALLASLMCSGMGIPMVILCFFYFVLAVSLRRALAAISVPAFAYIVWYFSVGHVGTNQSHTTTTQYLTVPHFVTSGLTHIWDTIIDVSGAGLVMLVVLALIPFLGRRVGLLNPVAAAGMAAVVCMYALIALPRVQLGVGAALAGRYVYVGAVLMFPALALLLATVLARAQRFNVVFHGLVTVAVALIVITGVQQNQVYTNVMVGPQAQTKAATIGAVSILKTNAKILSKFPDPITIPPLSTDQLSDPDVQAAFGTLHPTAQGLLDAAAAIQVGISATALGVPVSTSIATSGVSSAPGPDGCTQLTAIGPGAPYVDLGPSDGGAMILLRTPTTVIGTTLTRGESVSQIVRWLFVPNQPTYIGTSVSDATLRIFLPGGVTQLCPAG